LRAAAITNESPSGHTVEAMATPLRQISISTPFAFGHWLTVVRTGIAGRAATKAAMVPAVAAAADVVSSLSEQANAMAEAARQQAMAASKATNMSDFLDSVQGLGDVFGKGISLPTPIFGPRADERGWDGTKPLPDAIFRPVSPVSDRSQPIFGPQPVVNNITVQGSLIHERELDRVIGGGLFNTLRRDGGILGSI